MVEWWSDNGPPVYVSVAGYLGLIKKKNKGKNQQSSDLSELLKMAGAGGMIM